VDQVARGDAESLPGDLVDAEGSVGQAGGKEELLVLPDSRKLPEHSSVIVGLLVQLRVLERLRETLRVREQPIEVVEAAILRVDHDDRLDPVKLTRRC